MIDDLALRWIVTVLFSVSIAGYVCVLVAQPGRWTCTVNHLLHLVMSVAMIVMAWPVGMGLPTVGPMGFFFLAALWFVLVAARSSSGIPERLTNGYNAVMMTAMVWMYAAMNGSLPVNWLATAGFAVAALYWLYRYFAERRTNPVPHTAQLPPMGLLGQGLMAAGIALMFGVMR